MPTGVGCACAALAGIDKPRDESKCACSAFTRTHQERRLTVSLSPTPSNPGYREYSIPWHDAGNLVLSLSETQNAAKDRKVKYETLPRVEDTMGRWETVSSEISEQSSKAPQLFVRRVIQNLLFLHLIDLSQLDINILQRQ